MNPDEHPEAHTAHGLTDVPMPGGARRRICRACGLMWLTTKLTTHVVYLVPWNCRATELAKRHGDR